MIGILVLNALGFVARDSAFKAGSTSVMTALVVAPPVEIELGGQATLREMISLSEKRLRSSGPVDLVIWPESALSVDLGLGGQDSVNRDRLIDFVRRTGTDLLTGGTSYGPSEFGEFSQMSFNSDFLVDHRSLEVSTYQKTKLIPLAESVSPILFQLFSGTFGFADFGSWGAGRGPRLLYSGDRKISVSICYEGQFSSYATQMAGLSPDILINLTNDRHLGWGIHQHAIAVLAKAIETQKPLLFVSTMGLSALTLPSGKIVGMDKNSQDSVSKTFAIPVSQGRPSFFTKFGEILITLQWLWLVLTLFRRSLTRALSLIVGLSQIKT